MQSNGNGLKKTEFTVSGEDPSNYTTTNPYGIVTIINLEQDNTGQTLQTTTIAETIVTATALTAVGTGVFMYVKKTQTQSRISKPLEASS